MKCTRRKFVSLAALAAGCGRKAERADPVPGRQANGPLRLAMLPAGESPEFWKLAEAGARRAAQERKLELSWKALVREEDREQPLRALESAYEDNPSALALAAADGRALNRALQVPNPKKIPVVLFGKIWPLEDTSGVAAMIGVDQREAGANAAYELARALKGRGKVVLFRHEEGSDDGREREQGFLDVLRKHPALELISSGQHAGKDQETARSRVSELWPRFREADGFYASGEPGALALATALAIEKAVSRPLITHGFSPEMLNAVSDGRVRALVMPIPGLIGETTVNTMVSLLAGEAVPRQIHPALALITLENRRSPEVRLMLGET